ncbi:MULTISPECIES: MobF family relaxase [unclassified Crossiella]|uniref:MobF family relaxase n=1 Tax=unclassified Crossiella TaxID=2620835 RepID=UPI0020002B51|nr:MULTISPECIES: MobF family relaxase [unclassified Crossiella]MCK2239992.1 relaxase domain-containing protein [Crossiella sp. S99.2]MCK2252700.1 relaxase domain-containing protein [Crossiella sp. S99.1]
MSPVAQVTPIGQNRALWEYRLGQKHPCHPDSGDGQLTYRIDATERPLMWIGKGLATVGIQANTELTKDQFPAARRLREGRHPRTGDILVKAKRSIPHAAKVPAKPLVSAIRSVAAEADVDIDEILPTQNLRDWFTTAEREVAAKGDRAFIAADRAGRLADLADLNVNDLWGEDVYATAAANLFEVIEVVSEDGTVTEQRVPRRVITGNAGYDITFHIPKSASLLLAFAPQDIAENVEEIYLRAIHRTFAWLESTTAYVMRGKHGKGHTATTLPAEGYLGWTMVHRAARPVEGATVGDPHWHVHLTLANMARGSDGGWSTIAAGGRDLIRHAKAAGEIAKALIRYDTAEQLGIRWERNHRNGAWEIAGVPQATLDRFSRRRAEIRSTLTAMGIDPDKATQHQRHTAEQNTRQAKDATSNASDALLRDIWQDMERAAGSDPQTLIEGVLHHTTEPPAPPTVAEIAAQLLHPSTGLTANARRFTRAQALARVADQLGQGARSPHDIEVLTDAVLAHAGFIPLPRNTNATGGNHVHLGADHMANTATYTTTDVLTAEKTILRAAQNNPTTALPHLVIDTDLVDLALDTAEVIHGHALTDEQTAAVRRLTGLGTALDALEGGPGTGKTTTMAVVRSIFTAAGCTIAGAATAAVAAANLQVESGIPSKTIAQWLHRIHGPPDTPNPDPDAAVHEVTTEDLLGLTGIDVLIIDEANLTDDRDRAVIYTEAQRTGTKIIEIGDSKQLRGVGIGSLFRHIHDIVGGLTLSDNRRQIEEDERAAIASWRDGRYAEALTQWLHNQRLIVTETGDEATAAMLATWLHQRQGAPDPHTEMRGLVMLAAHNDTVNRINAAAQALRLTLDELGEGRTYDLGGGNNITFHLGDHIMLRRNDRGQINVTGNPVLNGYRGLVTGIGDTGTLRVEWQQDTPEGRQTKTADLSRRYIENGGVDLAYAMTLFKSEGLTVRDTWTLPEGFDGGGTVLFDTRGADANGFHVATSRHLRSVHAFAARSDLETDTDTYLYGTPTPEERDHRVIAKLAAHARSTATHGNDRPVVLDLRLPEFADEEGHLLGSHAYRTRDEPDRRQAREQARQRAEADRNAARRRREVIDLLRDTWIHHQDLITHLAESPGFDRFITRLDQAVEAGWDTELVIGEIPIETLASPRVRDKAAFLAYCVDDAVRHLRRAAERAEAEQARQQARDQAADLLHEAWPNHPDLVHTLYAETSFDALVRAMDRHHQAGLDLHDLLSRLALDKIADPSIVHKSRFSAYLLNRLVDHDAAQAEREHQAEQRRLAELHRRDIAAEALHEVWGTHHAVHAVLTGPAFGALAYRIEQALDRGYDPDDVRDVLAAVAPGRVLNAHNPSAYTTAVFTKNLAALPDPTTTPEPEQAETHPEASPAQHPDSAPQHPEAEAPHPEPETATPQPEAATTPPPPAAEPPQPSQPEPEPITTDHDAPWQLRPYGGLDEDTLYHRITATERSLTHLDNERLAAAERADELTHAARQHTGLKVTALEVDLAYHRERAIKAEHALKLHQGYQDYTALAEDAARQRAQALYDRASGTLSRDARTRAESTIAQATVTERRARHMAEACAEEAADLTPELGPPANYRRIITMANAVENDYDFARQLAVQRDHDTANSARLHHQRLHTRVVEEATELAALRAEKRLRDHQPEPVRQAEALQRQGALTTARHPEQAHTADPVIDYQPGAHPIIDTDIPAPHPAPEPGPDN